MVNTKKLCGSCGPVDTRYMNCPRCWGPVSRLPPGMTVSKEKEAELTAEREKTRLAEKVRDVATLVREAKLTDEERQRLVDDFLKCSKI